MKGQKILSLDIELIDELKKIPNASNLINEFLKDYFNQSGHLKKKELKEKLNQLTLLALKTKDDMEIIEKQIISIEKEENRINETYKNIPKEIMEDFNFFNKMTKESLFIRYKNIYSKRFKDLDWNELKKAFCEFKEIKEDAE